VPTAKKRLATATPTSPVVGSAATIENVDDPGVSAKAVAKLRVAAKVMTMFFADSISRPPQRIVSASFDFSTGDLCGRIRAWRISVPPQMVIVV
jgi:hypothetical protein